MSNLKIFLILIVFFTLGIILYFMTPFTGDIYVFLGSSRLADIQYDGGIMGAIKSWDLKPLGNRILVYIFYKISTLLVDFSQKQEFLFVLKLLFFHFILIIAYFITKILSYLQILNTLSKINLYSFSLIFLIFHSYAFWLQAEFFGFLFAIISVYFYFSDSKYSIYLSGFILAIIPLLKTITLIFVIQVFLFIMLFDEKNKNKLLRLFLSTITIFFTFIIIIFIIYPQEFNDMMLAPKLQSTFNIWSFSYLRTLLLFPFKYFLYAGSYPFIALASVIVVFMAVYSEIGKNIKLRIIALWFLGFGYVIIQNKYFIYHFSSLSLPALATLILFYKNSQNYLPKWKKYVVIFLASIFLVQFIIINTPINYILSSSRFSFQYKEIMEEYQSILLIAKYKPKDLDNQKVLYIEGGIGVFAWDSKTESKYFYPLPVQRLKYNTKLKNSLEYNNLINKILHYQGKYILLHKKWFISNYTDLRIINKLSKYREIKRINDYYILSKN